MLQSGDLLDGIYEIRGRVGVGGGGEIFRAWHTRLKKDVVVKRIREQVRGKLNDRAEADILKNLKHMYLPQVYDFLNIGDEIYTVMDLIPGKSFEQELEDGKKFTQQQVIKWAGQLSEALAYLHKQKPPIIHSDLKPGNVMLTPDGDICLIDFNISRLFDGASSIPLGRSNGYAAPEQYPLALRANRGQLRPAAANADATELLNMNRVEPDETELLTEQPAASRGDSGMMSKLEQNAITIDERTDIYGLGATLYHILTGQKPNTSIYGVKPVCECGVPVSDGLAYILGKAMEPDIQKRFASAEEMLHAVRGIHKLDGAYRRQARVQQIGAVALALLFAVSLFATVAGWNTLGQEKSDRYYQMTADARQLAETGNYQQAQALTADAKALYPQRPDAYFVTALSLFRQGEYEACVQFVDETRSASLEFAESGEALRADMDFIRGNAWFETGDYAQAVKDYRLAISRNSNNSEYYRDYAIAQARLGEIEAAQKILEEAVQKGLDNADVLLVSGEIARVRQEHAQAAESFLQVIQGTQEPYLLERAFTVCAQVYRDWNGHQEQEIILLEQAVENLPESQSYAVTEMLGDAYSRKGQETEDPAYYQKAVDCFQRLIQRGYSRFYLMHNVAILHQNMGNYTQAKDMLETMQEKFPENYKVYLQMAFLLADEQLTLPNESRDYAKVLENYTLAQQYYKDAAKNNATDPQMLMLDDLVTELRSGGWIE